MSRLRVHGFSVSLDGFGAGPRQDLDNPIGVGGEALHEWILPTRTFEKMQGGGDGGETGIDDDFAARGVENIGAWILGRNMFGPIRGPWTGEWKGWWGENPPYHVPVFVLTRHPRASLEMAGGTTFHFVTDGLESALRRAKQAANGKDVRLGGGVSLVRQCLQARLIDEMHVAISPVLLGSGEHLLNGIDTVALGYSCREHVNTAKAAHFVLTKGGLS